MLLDPAESENLILLCHRDEMPQPLLEFFGAFACAVDEGDADANVGG